MENGSHIIIGVNLEKGIRPVKRVISLQTKLSLVVILNAAGVLRNGFHP
jgi:hypothetical protein